MGDDVVVLEFIPVYPSDSPFGEVGTVVDGCEEEMGGEVEELGGDWGVEFGWVRLEFDERLE